MKHPSFVTPASQILNEIRQLISDAQKYEQVVQRSIAQGKTLDPIQMYNQMIIGVEHCLNTLREQKASLEEEYNRIKDENKNDHRLDVLNSATTEIQNEVEKISSFDAELKEKLFLLVKKNMPNHRNSQN